MRRLHRRSFLVSVTGAMLAGSAPLQASVLPPRRGLCSDTDKGPNADPANSWVADRDTGEPGDPIVRPEPNYSDADRGPYSDHGRATIGFCGYKRRIR